MEREALRTPAARCSERPRHVASDGISGLSAV
jgi:hypothetical protein